MYYEILIFIIKTTQSELLRPIQQRLTFTLFLVPVRLNNRVTSFLRHFCSHRILTQLQYLPTSAQLWGAD
jgi:hypothetical protein